MEVGRSLVFFYLNYDNPVSADDYKYALVGCARLADISGAGTFPFDADEIAKLRASSKHMKNFPAINWALKLTHQGEQHAVVLPYHAYIKHLAIQPEDGAKLEEIRVLVDEPALLPRFKYVSEQVHDDHALALLYKLRRALECAQVHGIADVDGQLDRIDGFIADCWADRGLYPGLGAIVAALADLAGGEVKPEGGDGHALVAALKPTLAPGADLADAMFELLAGKGPPPAPLVAHKRMLRSARLGFRDHEAREALLRKLALFTLTSRQIGRIMFPNADGVPAFGAVALGDGDIAANPYLLAESYVAATSDPAEDRADLDREQRSDSAIDYAIIDIGMFPDDDHLEPHDDLHDLTVAGPERLRAFAIEALRAAEALGHSFVSSVRCSPSTPPSTHSSTATNSPLAKRNFYQAGTSRISGNGSISKSSTARISSIVSRRGTPSRSSCGSQPIGSACRHSELIRVGSMPILQVKPRRWAVLSPLLMPTGS